MLTMITISGIHVLSVLTNSQILLFRYTRYIRGVRQGPSADSGAESEAMLEWIPGWILRENGRMVVVFGIYEEMLSNGGIESSWVGL